MMRLIQLLMIVRSITPALQTTIRAMLDQLAADAGKTPGTADDEAVRCLKDLARTIGIY